MLGNHKPQAAVRGAGRELTLAARKLRDPMVPAELLFWNEPRNRRLSSHKFRRQHPLGHFILDFCCSQLKLAKEFDGPIHNGQKERDAARTQLLNEHGYQVLRFTNDQLFSAMPAELKLNTATMQSLQAQTRAQGADISPLHLFSQFGEKC